MGSLFGLGGGCFRGDGRPLLWSRLNTECRGDRVDGPAKAWTRPSTAIGTGTELPWKCLGPPWSSALGRNKTQTAPPREAPVHYSDGNSAPAARRQLVEDSLPHPTAGRWAARRAACPSFPPCLRMHQHAAPSSPGLAKSPKHQAALGVPHFESDLH